MILQRTKTGDWAYCLNQLGKTKLADASQGMKDRINRGTQDREHFKSGAWFSENFNCIGGKIYAARREFNPLIPYSEQAVEAHRSGKEFYLTDEITSRYNGEDVPVAKLLVEIADADSKKPSGKRRVTDLGKVIAHNVPTDSFADDETIVFLARGKELANKYGLFLRKDIGFQEVEVYYMPLNEKDYARSFRLARLDGCGRSDFVSCGRGLDYGGGSVFGVVSASEASAQKFSPSKVRISQPSLVEILRFSKGYIGSNFIEEFKLGLRNLFERK